jgi:peroxiredoxin family protein
LTSFFWKRNKNASRKILKNSWELCKGFNIYKCEIVVDLSATAKKDKRTRFVQSNQLNDRKGPRWTEF